MCNACGFQCCAYDGFDGCGCDCDEPMCRRCDFCDRSGHDIEDCPEGWGDDDGQQPDEAA